VSITQTVNQKTFDAHKKREHHCEQWLKELHKQALKPVLLATLAGTINGVLMIGQAALLSLVLHQMIMEKQSWQELKVFLAVLLGVFVLRSLCVYFFQVWGFSAATRVKQKVRQQLMEQIEMSGPAFLKEQHSGQLAVTTLEQCEAMDNYFCRYLPQKKLAVLIPLMIIAVVFPVNWVVGIIFLLTGPLVPVFMALIGMGASAASRNQFLEMERMGACFLDRLQGITTLKLFGQAEYERVHIQQVADRFREKTMNVLRIAFLSSAVLEFFSAVSVALVAVYVGLGLLGLMHFGPAVDISLQEALFVLLLAPEFFMPLRQLAINYHDRAAALAAADSILKVLEQPPCVHRNNQSSHSDCYIQIKNLSKSFQQRQVLNNINLQVEKGEKLVLTGETGSGKTTLFNLLLGFEQPTAGHILIKGQSFSRERLADQFAWVGQKAAVFYGSIADNISLFNDDIAMDRVVTAAQAAGVTEFSDSLSHGLHTIIGEQGYGLSGGQIQRIALARAMLKNADIILLDEPTAHLDDAGKKQLMATISELFRDKTVLIASHDPVVIQWMDRRVHIEQGALL